MIIHILDNKTGYIIKGCIGELYTTEVVDKPGKCDLLLARSEYITKYKLDKDKVIVIDDEIPSPIRSSKVKEVVIKFIDKNGLGKWKRKEKVQKARPTSAEMQEALKNAKSNKKK